MGGRGPVSLPEEVRRLSDCQAGKAAETELLLSDGRGHSADLVRRQRSQGAELVRRTMSQGADLVRWTKIIGQGAELIWPDGMPNYGVKLLSFSTFS